MKALLRILSVFLIASMISVVTVRAEEASDIKFSGFVDAYYSYNFNNPDSMKNGPGTNFDFEHNTFSLNLAELVVSKPAEPVGFRMDLDFGPTTDFVHGNPITGPATFTREAETFKHIQQAYVSWATPLKVNLDFGKFVTHMGAEVIESKDNWNYTRGLLFCCAIPYYHAGVRANYPINGMLFVNGYVYNGWNNVVENNDSKTFGATIGITPIPQLPILLNWIGPEEAEGFYTDRQLYEVLVTYNATDFLSFIADYNYATQEDVPSGDDFTWSGVAVYAKWTITDANAVILRYETTDDEDNVMYSGTTADGNKIQEITLTYEHKHGNGLIVRLEYRQDMSDDDIYEEEDGEVTDSQGRVVLGAIYTF